MSDQMKQEPEDEPGVLRQPQPQIPDPLEGARMVDGVWVDKDGKPLSPANAELARQRLTRKGEPRKQPE
jgi:hypothetical protein